MAGGADLMPSLIHSRHAVEQAHSEQRTVVRHATPSAVTRRIRRLRLSLIATTAALGCLSLVLAVTVGWLLATDGGRERSIAMPDSVGAYDTVSPQRQHTDWSASAERYSQAFGAAAAVREYVDGGRRIQVLAVRTELPAPPPGLIQVGASEPLVAVPTENVTCRVAAASGQVESCVRTDARLSISVTPSPDLSVAETGRITEQLWRALS